MGAVAPLRVPVDPIAGARSRPQDEVRLLNRNLRHAGSLNHDLRLGINFFRLGINSRLGIRLGIKQA